MNLNDLQVEIYREPHFEGFFFKTVLSQGELVTPAAFPDITVNVSDLFRRQ